MGEETRCRWEDNIKMDPKEIEWDSINWIDVAGSTEHDNEPSAYTKCRVFSD